MHQAIWPLNGNKLLDSDYYFMAVNMVWFDLVYFTKTTKDLMFLRTLMVDVENIENYEII